MKNSYLKAIEHTKKGMDRKVIFQIKRLTSENKELPSFHLFEWKNFTHNDNMH